MFVRLLYEDWDKSWQIKPVVKGVTPAVKGTLVWFKELENFCLRYEYRAIPREDVVIEKTGKVLLDRATIARLLKETKDLSRADKISRLTDYLMARLENAENIIPIPSRKSRSSSIIMRPISEKGNGRALWRNSTNSS